MQIPLPSLVAASSAALVAASPLAERDSAGVTLNITGGAAGSNESYVLVPVILGQVTDIYPAVFPSAVYFQRDTVYGAAIDTIQCQAYGGTPGALASYTSCHFNADKHDPFLTFNDIDHVLCYSVPAVTNNLNGTCCGCSD